MPEEPIQTNDAPATEAPAPETAPGDTTLFGAQGFVMTQIMPGVKHSSLGAAWPNLETFQQAYMTKNDPRHQEAVNTMQRAFLSQQKQADNKELEAMGGKDAVPEGEMPATVELPPARAGQEWDEGAAAQAIAVAEAAGVPTALIQEAFDVIAQHGAPPMDAEEGEAILRRELGNEFDDTLAAANAVLNEFPAMKDFIIESGYGNDPSLIIWLALQAETRGDVQKEINELSATDAYRQGGHQAHDETVERVRLLYKKLYA